MVARVLKNRDESLAPLEMRLDVCRNDFDAEVNGLRNQVAIGQRQAIRHCADLVLLQLGLDSMTREGFRLEGLAKLWGHKFDEVFVPRKM